MNVGQLVELRHCEMGDIIAFSPRGVAWRVMHKGGNVIQIKSENGSWRTYVKSDKRWRDDVIVIARRE